MARCSAQLADRDEAYLARRLLHLLRPGMLLLLDRGFDANTFFAEVHATGAALLARARSARNPRVLRHLPDGSYLSDLDGLAVRIIEADVTITGSDGSRTGDTYRLITTLTDHHRYPASSPGPALPRTVGDRECLLRAAAHPAGRPRAALLVTGPAWNRKPGHC